MADYQHTFTPTAAGTYLSEVHKFDPNAVRDIAVQSDFDYGSGGTTAKLYVQTSVDDGDTWVDVICHAFLLADLRKVSAVKRYSARAEAVATDGALADDTELDGFIGDRIRYKLVTTGTYANTKVTVSTALA